MKQEPTPPVRQDGVWPWRRVVSWLQRAWHIGHRQLRDRGQHADTFVTPLSERPLWCVAAGLLAGRLLGTVVDLHLLAVGGDVVIVGFLLILCLHVPKFEGVCHLC